MNDRARIDAPGSFRGRGAVLGAVLLAGLLTPGSADRPTATRPPATVAWKRPPAGNLDWDWQIGAPEGRLRPPRGSVLIDVDGFETSAATVARLRARGLYTVCYLNVGSWESWRPDARAYPSFLLLHPDPEWPGEVFLDVRDVFRPNSTLARLLHRRLRMCRNKGFDAVEPDNLQNDDNVPSGVIRRQDQIDFSGWVADAAHAWGLAIFQKNGADKILGRDRSGTPLADKFDGIIYEECRRYDECGTLRHYVRRGKPALNVEYTGPLDCAVTRRWGVGMMERDPGLVAPGMTAYRRRRCS